MKFTHEEILNDFVMCSPITEVSYMVSMLNIYHDSKGELLGKNSVVEWKPNTMEYKIKEMK